MTETNFEFQLTSEDYAKAIGRGYANKAIVIGYLQRALIVGLVFWVIGRELSAATPIQALTVSLVAALIYSAYNILVWRSKYETTLLKHFGSAPQNVILGSHSMTFNDEGILSAGPVHQSLRR